MTPRPIIIDTDPGHDDALALLLAFASPEEIDLRGITTVAGNVPLALTTKNALKLCELAGMQNVAVYAGCSGPMLRELVTAEYIHGVTGLDGPVLPEPTKRVEPRHAVDFLIDELLAADDGEMTVCLLGPMTNLALALIKQPDIVAKIGEVVLMGGSFHAGGNVTPTAEFNVYVDPHAASVVFNSGIPLTIMPLDVTHRAQALPERIAALRSMGTPIAGVISQMLEFVGRFDVARYGFEGFPLHDPCVIAYLLEPGIFIGRAAAVIVDIGDGPSLGATVADWWGTTVRPVNATVMMDLDDDRYFEVLTERIARL